MPYANNKGADQPANPCCLISVFVVRCLDSIISLVSTFATSAISCDFRVTKPVTLINHLNLISGDYKSMRKDKLDFEKEKYSDTRSVQENFELLTSFIQDSADKHMPSKTSRSVSLIPWITPEIRRKIRGKNKTHVKAKKTGRSKLRCRSQHVSVESSSLLHHCIYLWFVCFTWWSIDELENLHEDRPTVCFEPW